MAKDSWLPRRYELQSGARLRSVLCTGKDWQLASTYGYTRVLLARAELVQRWIELKLLDDTVFSLLPFGQETFLALESGKRYSLFSLASGETLKNKVDALAFAAALKETRKLLEKVSFHDAIYVEQYSRLLPTWTETPPVDDETLLGLCLTGGVALPATDLRRLTNLTGWPTEDLRQIVTAAGFPVSADGSELVRHREVSDMPQGKARPAPEETVSHLRDSKVFCLPGRPKLEAFLREHVIDIVAHPERYAAMGIGFPSAIILHGPPGCGKTYAAERLVEFLGWPCYCMDSGSVGSPYIHETSKKIAELFDKAMENAPSVLIIDEMESYLTNRQASLSGGVYHVEEVSEFLRRIPEASKKKVLVIAMTNVLDMLDPAILRRGRFDHIVEVGMPTRDEVTSLVASLLENLPKDPNLDLGHLIDALTGKPLSDTAFLIHEAARITAKKGKTFVDQESINDVLNEFSERKENSSTRLGFV